MTIAPHFVAVMLTLALLEVLGAPGYPWLREAIHVPQAIKIWKEPSRTAPGEHGLENGYYVGKLYVGKPEQELLVNFDTASGQVILPSSSCESRTCLEHRRYSPEASETAVDVNADGKPVNSALRLAGDTADRDAISIGFATGMAQGRLLREVACLSDDPEQPICAQIGLVLANNLTDAPFRAMPGDGVMGLGLAGLSLNPLFNFMDSLGRRAWSSHRSCFSLYLGPADGELTLGGYNPTRLASPLQWVKVKNPEEGFWQLSVQSIRIGNQTVLCAVGGCSAIIDNGASSIQIPASMAPNLDSAIAGIRGCTGSADADMHITLIDGPVLTLSTQDYLAHTCSLRERPFLSKHDLPGNFQNVILLGEPFFAALLHNFRFRLTTAWLGNCSRT